MLCIRTPYPPKIDLPGNPTRASQAGRIRTRERCCLSEAQHVKQIQQYLLVDATTPPYVPSYSEPHPVATILVPVDTPVQVCGFAKHRVNSIS